MRLGEGITHHQSLCGAFLGHTKVTFHRGKKREEGIGERRMWARDA